MPSDAKVSLVRVSSAKEDDYMELRVQDVSSGMSILKLKVDIANVGDLLTSRETEGQLAFLIKAELRDRVGLSRVTQVHYCPKTQIPCADRKASQRELVMQSLTAINAARDDDPVWELWDDGVGTQQLQANHRFVICRYLKS